MPPELSEPYLVGGPLSICARLGVIMVSVESARKVGTSVPALNGEQIAESVYHAVTDHEDPVLSTNEVYENVTDDVTQEEVLMVLSRLESEGILRAKDSDGYLFWYLND